MIRVGSHPLKAKDRIEAGSFARDIILASIYAPPASQRGVWLTTRARSRRDLLFFVREVLGKDRITERIHRAPASWLMRQMTTPHAFANFRDVRGNGKTTLATEGGALWCAIQDPIACIARGWPIRGRESRLGITTLNEEMTMDFLGLIISDLESETFSWCFPELMPDKRRRWGVKKGVELRRGLTGPLARLRDESLFARYPRDVRHKEPTFANGSLEKGRASAHTHGELIDDPVNEKTWNSAVSIETATHAIKQLYNVSRTERGFRIIIGNHWCPGDVADGIDTDPEVTRKWQVFMRSAVACDACRDGYPTDSSGLVPRDDTGDWAHVHDPETTTSPWMMEEAGGVEPDLDEIRASCGSYHIFSAQYLNRPLAGESTLWKSSMLPRFTIDASTWWRMTERERAASDAAVEGDRPMRPPALLAGASTVAMVPDRNGRIARLSLSDCAITIAYDPAHAEGSAKRTARSSDHAITALARTPYDQLLLVDAWSGRPEDPLEAVDEFLRIIWRFKTMRLKVGVEKVGYQRVVRNMLLRELFRPRDEEGRPTKDGSGSRITWLRPDNVVAVPRSRAEGDTIAWIRDSLGPLISDGAIALCSSVRQTGSVLTAIEGFPISRVGADLRASLALHLPLLDRVPMRPGLRAASFQKQKQREARRRFASGVTGYGPW